MQRAADSFSELADLLPEALLLVTAGGTVHALNDAAARFFGRPRPELTGNALATFVCDNDAAIATLVRAGSRSRAPLPGNLTILKPDSGRLACRCEVSVFRPRSADSEALVLLRLSNRDQAASRFVLLNERIEELSREITRRRAAEEALGAATEHLRVTLASIGDAVIATDRTGHITFMNAVAESLTGWPLEEAKSRHLDDVFVIVNEETRQAVESPVAKVLRLGGIVGLANHTMLIRADGTELPIDDSGAPIIDANGAMIGVVLVFHDITERHALQKEIAQKAQRLQEADRRKDEFLSMLAHELRNPLAPLRTGIHLLDQQHGSLPEVARLAGMMNRQVSHMVRLVDDLLDVSRLTRGTIELRPEPVRLGAAVDQALEMVRPSIEAHDVGLKRESGPGNAVVEGDLARLVQVFANLLTNAVKFTGPGGTITLSACCTQDEVRISVRDTGCGIDPALLPEIFELFVQGTNDLDRSEGGLGIGLTIVRSIVQLHGGSISGHSDGPGCGSEFTVALPLLQGGQHLADGAAATTAAEQAHTGLEVLVVDDNVDAAETLASILELWGHRPSVAHDARRALDLVSLIQPRVALMDIGLPGMDGYELARAVRATPQLRPVVLVAVTGYGDAAARQQSLEAGFDYHMTKPVDLSALERLLASAAGWPDDHTCL